MNACQDLDHHAGFTLKHLICAAEKAAARPSNQSSQRSSPYPSQKRLPGDEEGARASSAAAKPPASSPERKGLVQQLQFWRREGSPRTSRSSEPEEAVIQPASQQLPPPQHSGEQEGALDDVDSLMARLAEQQVHHHACPCSGGAVTSYP